MSRVLVETGNKRPRRSNDGERGMSGAEISTNKSVVCSVAAKGGIGNKDDAIRPMSCRIAHSPLPSFLGTAAAAAEDSGRERESRRRSRRKGERRGGGLPLHVQGQAFIDRRLRRHRMYRRRRRQGAQRKAIVLSYNFFSYPFFSLSLIPFPPKREDEEKNSFSLLYPK